MNLAKFPITPFLQTPLDDCFSLFILKFISTVIYTFLFILICLAYICLRLLIYTYVLFTIGNIETTTKFSKLKSISSTEDNYLEAATESVL